MNHMQTNTIIEFYSKLNKFRSEEKHTDVTVVFEERSFKCHRTALAVACEYFDKLFSSAFKDSTTENISGLKDIMSDVTFEEVLKFIYTGDVTITSGNVYNLLQASEFLKLRGIEDLCVGFIKKNMPLENTADLFVFACTTEKFVLIDLLTRDMGKEFAEFSKTTNYLTLPFDVLVSMINQCTSQKEDTMLNAIFRWLNHDREGRLKYVEELDKLVQVSNFSYTLMRYMLKKLFTDSRITEIENDQEFLDLQHEASKSESSSLYMYFGQNSDTSKIFSVDSICFDSHYLFDVPFSNLHSVALDNSFLYSLSCQQEFTFFATSSIDLRVRSCVSFLNDPQKDCHKSQLPSDKNMAMCANEKNFLIYVYNKSFTFASSQEYIFYWTEGISNWMGIGPMKTPLQQSSMTACGDLLYFIGGEYAGKSVSEGYVQACDCRCSGSWLELPKSKYRYTGAASCTFNEKIYVCNHDGECEIYDPVAGKWDVIESVNPWLNFYYRKMIPFADQLWLFSTNRANDKDFRVQLYNPKLNKWSNYSLLNRLVENTSGSFTFQDAVVFKSLQ